MVAGGLRRARRSRRPKQPLHRRHRRRRDAHVAPLRRGLRHRAAPTWSRAVFFGLGADGTVGANKNSIKIIGEETDGFAQGYFVYDSKKSGAVTISHLRFGPRPDPLGVPRPHAPSFVACHQFEFLDRYDVLETRGRGRRVPPQRAVRPRRGLGPAPARGAGGDRRPKSCSFFVIDAYRVAREAGLGGRINTIMQTCFFAISGVAAARGGDRADQEGDREDLRQEGRRGREAQLRGGRRGARRPRRGAACPARSRPRGAGRPSSPPRRRTSSSASPRVMLAGQGDLLPVCAFPVDGTWPTGTAQWEKRNIADRDPGLGPGALHPVQQVRAGLPARGHPRQGLRAGARSRARPRRSSPTDFRGAEFAGLAVHDPGRAGGLHGLHALRRCSARPRTRRTRSTRRSTWRRRRRCASRSATTTTSSSTCPSPTARASRSWTSRARSSSSRSSSTRAPAPAAARRRTSSSSRSSSATGRSIANATGCSSIYGGNLPTTPYTANRDGRGPAWSNSLFEDNAEFGLGMRLALDQPRRARAAPARRSSAPALGDGARAARSSRPTRRPRPAIAAQRERVAALQARARGARRRRAAGALAALADYLVKKSVWIVGGDGWAYDIGFGGLDHVLSLPAAT